MEDESIVALDMKNTLTNFGYEVTNCVTNYNDAVNSVQTDKPELILMDIQMPIMNGYEATKIIRDIDKNIPIISFTANISDEDIVYSEILGMNDYLTKPINVEKKLKNYKAFFYHAVKMALHARCY